MIVVLAVVVLAVTAPLRTGAKAGEQQKSRIAELESARELKLGEIRDAELDFRTGKLSEGDFRTLDRQLRAEAVEILHRLDRARGAGPPPAD